MHGEKRSPDIYVNAVSRFYGLVYPVRRPVLLTLYGLIAATSYQLAYLLRFEFQVPAEHWATFLYTLPAVVGIRLVFASLYKLSSGRWRFISTPDVVRLVAAIASGSLLLFLIRPWLPGGMIPRSVLLLEALLSIQITAALWIGYRLTFERVRHARSPFNGDRRRVLIVGAGEAASLLGREMQRFPTGYRLVGFVDDDRLKWGCRIHGAPVLGGMKDLPALVHRREIGEIIIAIPSAQPEELRRLVELCEETNVPFKTLPGISEVLQGQVNLNQLRELKIEDLLGREPIELELPELAEDLHGRCVLITGAAGSIGSELARQVALHRPGNLILFDQAETDLFFLEQDLRRTDPSLRLVGVIGDVRDEQALTRTFTRYRPDRVFHAAAYKHVPLLEANPEQAVLNNVVGTYRVADAAGRFGAAKFILVSTDKAVQPVNIMGATKRLAEAVVLELQGRFPATSYGAVRFGNVLGSNGSVLPIFRRQLERGDPLTVTHPDVTRYFMTIPEAVQLILQASLLPDLRGHVAMLDMGEPVRILDLARNFLRLSGVPFRMGETLVFTGLRPGEKLHEELAAPDEESLATAVAKVRVLRSSSQTDLDVLHLIRGWDEPGDETDQVSDVAMLFDGLRPHRKRRGQSVEVVVAGSPGKTSAA